MERPSRPHGRSLIFACFACICTPSLLANDTQAPPTSADLARAGERTTERLQDETASWVALHELPSGRTFSVRTVATPKQRLWEVFSSEGENPLLRIIASEGLWYVRDGSRSFKCRPYEACFDTPFQNMLLARSELPIWTQAKESPGDFIEIKNEAAVFKVPFAEFVAVRIQKSLQRIKKTLAAVPKGTNRELEEQAAELELVLREGTSRAISVSSGIVVDAINPVLSLRIREFQWNPKIDPTLFTTEGIVWEDLTKPWKTPSSKVAIAGYFAAWRPGMQMMQTEAVLLDLATGNIRRIPFKSGIAATGCLSEDRKIAYVAGSAVISGDGIFEIDLDSGENRTIVTALDLGGGGFMLPTLSPDGKMLAVLGMFGETSSEKQVCLVELSTGMTQKLGSPISADNLSWLPDGKGLLVSSTTTDKLGRLGNSTIYRLELDGKLVELRRGWFPLALGMPPKMMFDDINGKADQWTLCGLDGRNLQLFGNGLKDHSFPSPSPDGKQVLMIRTDENKEPRLVIVDVASGESKAVPAPRGMWIYPSWN